MNDRSALLLQSLDRSSRILELGPSMSPVAPRSAGWNVTVVDHASREDLVEKYRNHPNVNVDRIEAVDIIWRGGPLHETVPAEQYGTFDALIASHVIEHLPDPIGFLDSAARLLHPERGVVVLAVPDKRWCFDALRQISTTGQMLVAHRLGAQRHGMATRFENAAYVAFDGQRIAWGREPLPSLRLADTLDHAYSEFQSWSPDPGAPYVDCHAWCFTPSSFELLILELGAIGLVDWHVSWLRPQPAVEFLVRLARGRQSFATPAERDRHRLELLKRILLDIREQTDWLLEPNPAETSSQQRLTVDADAQQRLNECQRLLQENQVLLQQIAETSWMVRTALRPARAAWHRALPLRRFVAGLRGRV